MKDFHRGRANASLISMMQRFSDISIILFSFYISFYIFNHFFDFGNILTPLLSLVVFQMIGGITDFYRSWRGVRISVELQLVIGNWILSLLLTLGISSIIFNYNVSFVFFVSWFALGLIGFIICRSFIRYVCGKLRNYGFNTRRVAVAGSMPSGIFLLKSFNRAPWLGFSVIGIYDEVPLEDTEISYIGSFTKLIEDAENGKLDKVYIALGMSEEAKIKELVRALANTTCSVLLIPDLFTYNILQSRTEEINGVPVVPLIDTPLDGINRVLKRLEDFFISLIILILISPILLIIAVAIKLTSSGPIIFKQIRYGMDGKPIKVWKFRSMTVMENNDVVIQAQKNDIRVTKVGRFLRRTSLDELPQFFNVLFGQMSIVGPRPHAVAHNEQYRSLIEGYMLRHKVKPGITGLAQINGWRGETDTLEKMQKRIEFDLLYIQNWSVFLDLKIIFLTIFKGFVSDSAY
ncbi:undecaprenyl-phosphate glucose phosphotransferase [Klebsiella pneumoniae subsp. pneumoniae]|uniref:undecaprenyl-phosphate glucose phosphotransferase n=1 Tax=Klebsiella pneumoniae TaxID=573 RepID=UPI003CEBB25E